MISVQVQRESQAAERRAVLGPLMYGPMSLDPIPLTVLVRTQSCVAGPLVSLFEALGIATSPTAGSRSTTICVCDAGREPVASTDACVELIADEPQLARARRLVGARNPSPDHPDEGLMPPAGHLATVLAEVTASAAVLQALSVLAGERPAPARVGAEHAALHIIMPLVSAASVGVTRASLPPTGSAMYPLGIVPCADGQVGAYQAVPTEWPKFCAMIGREDLVEAYPTQGSRRDAGEAIWGAAEPWFRARRVDDVVGLAQDAGLPYAAVLPLSDLPTSAYLARRGAIATGADGELRSGTPYRVARGEAPAAPPQAERESLRAALQAALPPALPGPLNGLIVAEVTQHWAGPLASRFLADHGALVVKCEPGIGDFWRSSGRLPDDPNVSWMFEPLNLGKTSIAVDLRDPADQGLLRALLGAADVVIDNLSGEARRRAGLDFGTVSGLNPEIIATSLPGYETEGPLADLRGMGWSFEAASGYASALGGGTPANSGYPYGDPIGALTAFLALLREILGRRLSGVHDPGGGTGAGGATLLDVGQVAALAYTLVETIRTAESGPETTPLNDALAQSRTEPSWSLERLATVSGRPMDHPSRLIALADPVPRQRAPSLDEHGAAIRGAVGGWTNQEAHDP